MIEATIICDSVSPQGKRLTTFKLRYPKFIHSEFMTHRVISRNASSSRAVPTKKLLEEVRDDALRAGPVFWGKNQSGMQAVEELSDKKDGHNELEFTLKEHEPFDTGWGDTSFKEHSPKSRVQWLWREAALRAVSHAEAMNKAGAHKQIVNRLLEPFSHINVVATATEWDNFFGLRLHKDAQPEMRALAIAMWNEYQGCVPRPLKPGEWHLPFVTDDCWKTTTFILASEEYGTDEKEIREMMIKVSVARCARVSYESFETGKRSTVEEDLKLYDRLLGAQPLHASPAEHQAMPDGEAHFMTFPWQGETLVSNRSDEWGNFKGWIQNRQLLSGQACAPIPEEFR